jgi:hypothetical protein
MDALEAIMLVALLVLPFHWLVRRELDKLEDPGYLRRHGLVIVAPGALDAHTAPIGRYQDREIWGSVTFKGMRYRFDRIVSEGDRERISARELYLAPGLVYVTD